jgi:hypothetical protein
MGSLGGAENVQTIFELLPFSVEHGDSRLLSAHSSLTHGLPLLLRSWTLPVSTKRIFQSLIALSLGGCLLNCVR